MKNQLTGHKRITANDHSMAKMGGNSVAKAAHRTAITLANERAFNEVASLCDNGRGVSEQRERRLKARADKALKQEAKRALWEVSEAVARENLRKRLI